MKDKILKKLNALEYLINSNGELFHDGINEELIEIINESKSIIKNNTIPTERKNLVDFDNIIKENKYSMLFMFIYYNLTLNYKMNFRLDTSDSEDIKNINTLINFIHDTYLKDEQHTDLSYICDKAVEHKDKILNKEWTRSDLLKSCYFNN